MNAAESNPDGFGYAFLSGDKIITGRGMDAKELIERFLRIREGLNECLAMFLTRYTTHGATNKANCHPFRVGGSEQIVLAHNGVLPLSESNGRSDTRVFAEDWLPTLGIEALDDEEMYAYLETWATGSKVAVFSVDPKLKHNVYILNEHLGHWSDGIWWSNYSYLPMTYGVGGVSRYGESCGVRKSSWEDYQEMDWDERLDAECAFCLSKGTIDPETVVCTNCMTCLDCNEDANDCLCYYSSRFRDSHLELDFLDIEPKSSNLPANVTTQIGRAHV
jgi:glutamine amidotransferase